MRDIAAIVARRDGRRSGRWWMFLCPCHGNVDTPSASISPTGYLHCFRGCSHDEIGAALDALGLVDDGEPSELDYEKLAADEAARIAKAQQMWADACALPEEHSTPYVAYYLKSRGITLPVPPDLKRYSDWRGKGFIAKLTNIGGLLTSVHTKVPGPKGGWNHGPPRHGAVQLFPPRDGEIGIAESVFDALSATQLFGVPCWSVCGNRLAAIDLPDGVDRVTLFADNDVVGRKAAQEAEYHYRNVVGVAARIVAPPADVKDWNEELMKRVKHNGR